MSCLNSQFQLDHHVCRCVRFMGNLIFASNILYINSVYHLHTFILRNIESTLYTAADHFLAVFKYRWSTLNVRYVSSSHGQKNEKMKCDFPGIQYNTAPKYNRFVELSRGFMGTFYYFTIASPRIAEGTAHLWTCVCGELECWISCIFDHQGPHPWASQQLNFEVPDRNEDMFPSLFISTSK